MHLLLFGILLGMGAAIPIGPINLEIIRRNLRFGTPFGIATGFGACAADLTYLVLLCLGALSLLQYPQVLRGLGFVGSFILAYFAVCAFRAKVSEPSKTDVAPSLIRYSLEGYLLTLINPGTILFWVSVSSQISMTAANNSLAIILAGSGVMIGAVGWVLFLNIMLHFTRHRLSITAMRWLNYLGGTILLVFAVLGLLRAAKLI